MNRGKVNTTTTTWPAGTNLTHAYNKFAERKLNWKRKATNILSLNRTFFRKKFLSCKSFSSLTYSLHSVPFYLSSSSSPPSPPHALPCSEWVCVGSHVGKLEEIDLTPIRGEMLWVNLRHFSSREGGRVTPEGKQIYFWILLTEPRRQVGDETRFFNRTL